MAISFTHNGIGQARTPPDQRGRAAGKARDCEVELPQKESAGLAFRGPPYGNAETSCTRSGTCQNAVAYAASYAAWLRSCGKGIASGISLGISSMCTAMPSSASAAMTSAWKSATVTGSQFHLT